MNAKKRKEDIFMDLFLLLLGTLMGGVYAIGLKPAMGKCRTNAAVELFNGATTLVATLAALVICAVRGAFYLPGEGILTAAIFGVIFSATVFFNLVALDYGPLSITNLVINFSLVVPLVYGFVFLDETITPLRVAGIGLFVVCMFLFCNPFEKTADTAGTPVRKRGRMLTWILLTMASFATNGMLMVIQKNYALKTENAYALSFLLYSYLFATVTSVVLAGILKLARRKPGASEPAAVNPATEPTSVPANATAIDGKRFWLLMGGFSLLVGVSNFVLNFAVILLATRMDAAIVYPVIQGGGPVIVTVVSYFLFREKLNLPKWLGVVLGCLGIVLLNL